MKKLFVNISVFVLFCNPLFADLGSSVVYHGKFHLKNGQSFNGFFEYSGYEEGTYLDDDGSNKFCSSKGMFQLFKIAQNRMNNGRNLMTSNSEIQKVLVFKGLHYIVTKPLKDNGRHDEVIYGVTAKDGFLFLDSTQVKSIKFKYAERNKRHWLTTRIEIVSATFMDTLLHKRYWNHLIAIPFDDEMRCDSILYQEGEIINDGPGEGYILYNYNSNINNAELKRLAKAKLSICRNNKMLKNYLVKHPVWKDDETYHWLKMQIFLGKEIRKTLDWFQSKGIMVFRINGTC